MVAENVQGLHIPVSGHVVVDLIDPDAGGAGSWRGKVVQREEQDNFVSQLWLERAKWEQRALWSYANPVKTNNALGFSPQEMPILPAEMIAAWNDASAENANDEIAVQKPIVAWASRWPIGSPSGKRGVVNITESEWKDTQTKWVFDWTTSQGNGTFRSVGFTRIDKSVNGGEATLLRYPEFDFIRMTPTNSGSTSYESGLYWDGSLFYTIEYVSSPVGYRVASFSSSGGATTAVVTIPSTIAVNSQYVRGLEKSGTDWYIVGGTNSTYNAGNPTIGLMNAAGVQQWRRTETTITDVYRDVTVDGSGNPWVVTGTTMRRLSTADGTIAATVTPAYGPTNLYGIAYDATDGNFWLFCSATGFVKVDSSGTVVGPCWGVNYTSDTATSPLSGTAYVNGTQNYEGYNRYYNYGSSLYSGLQEYRAGDTYPTNWTTGSVTNGISSGSTSGAPLAVKSGELWTARRSGVAGTTHATAIRGRNLGSRTRLDNAVAKTSSNALKITYTFTFS